MRPSIRFARCMKCWQGSVCVDRTLALLYPPRLVLAARTSLFFLTARLMRRRLAWSPQGMRTANYLGVALLMLASCACGCQLFPADHPMLHGQSPLKPAPASADSVAMEIVWARFPAND